MSREEGVHNKTKKGNSARGRKTGGRGCYRRSTPRELRVLLTSSCVWLGHLERGTGTSVPQYSYAGDGGQGVLWEVEVPDLEAVVVRKRDVLRNRLGLFFSSGIAPVPPSELL